MKDSMKRFLALVLMLLYFAIIGFGIFIIWKVAKSGYFVNPLKSTVEFIAFMLAVIGPVWIALVLAILPDRKKPDKGDKDR